MLMRGLEFGRTDVSEEYEQPNEDAGLMCYKIKQQKQHPKASSFLCLSYLCTSPSCLVRRHVNNALSMCLVLAKQSKHYITAISGCLLVIP